MFRVSVVGKQLGVPFTKLTKGIWKYTHEDCYILILDDGSKIYMSDGCVEMVNEDTWSEQDCFVKIDGTISIRYAK